MSTEKRERQKINRQQKLEEQKKQAEKDKKKSLIIKGVVALGLLLGTLFLVSILSNEDEPEISTDPSVEISETEAEPAAEETEIDPDLEVKDTETDVTEKVVEDDTANTSE